MDSDVAAGRIARDCQYRAARILIATLRGFLRLFAALCAWIVVACGPALQQLPLTAPNPNLARVYIIDDISGVYAVLPYHILIDGRSVCTLRGGQFAVVDLDPGRHRFLLEANQAAQDFDTVAGVTYLRLTITKLREDASLVPIESAAAEKAMASATRIETLLPSR